MLGTKRQKNDMSKNSWGKVYADETNFSRKQEVGTEEYSDHPNEVVKNEELTYNGATSYGFGQVLFLIVSSLLTSVIVPQLLR
ncbi:hypothetical protein M0802_012557 [Mischocyttarus mexicanus]|nr:hypothetical protein M0802_012557 [Mischocyttarus mexicanus]